LNETPRYGLPLLAAGQAQKEVSHNEALIVIDRWLNLIVETRLGKSCPDEPTVGSAYIVPPDATGSWAGRGGSVASYDGIGWNLDRPRRGALAWIADERCFAVFDDVWVTVGCGPQVN
jgi:hypothetical protein